MQSQEQIPQILQQLKMQNGALGGVCDALMELYAGMKTTAETMGQAAACPPGMDMSFVRSYPPGHYYSPLPSMEEVARAAPQVWGELPETLPGIDLRTAEQEALLLEFTEYYADMPFEEERKPGLRYFFNNPHFCHFDAIVLYSMLQKYKPQKVVEVGSGLTSCLMLDTDQLFLGGSTQFTFIEPYSERLLSNISAVDKDRVTIIEKFVQDVDFGVFESLSANDILFLDCSHVAKIGSDVCRLIFEVLPRLKPGVIVHIHDIFYPFEYPREWVEKSHRAWNESYIVRAFLQYNNAFDIMLFNNYLGQMRSELLKKHMPVAMNNIGGSLWLRKVKEP